MSEGGWRRDGRARTRSGCLNIAREGHVDGAAARSARGVLSTVALWIRDRIRIEREELYIHALGSRDIGRERDVVWHSACF